MDLITGLLRRLFPAHYEVSVAAWDDQFKNGHWNYLAGVSELARYSAIVGYIRYFKLNGSILDVGCGQGVLQERIGNGNYSRYVGIDISAAAIHEAEKKNDTGTHFIQCAVEQFKTSDRYDVIVFNEVLYYLPDPISSVIMYERFLNRDGIFIISKYVPNKMPRDFWKLMDARYALLDETKVINRAGHAWVCKVFQKK